MCLESENEESESEPVMENQKNKTMADSDDEKDKMGWCSRLFGSTDLLGMLMFYLNKVIFFSLKQINLKFPPFFCKLKR